MIFKIPVALKPPVRRSINAPRISKKLAFQCSIIIIIGRKYCVVTNEYCYFGELFTQEWRIDQPTFCQICIKIHSSGFFVHREPSKRIDVFTGVQISELNRHISFPISVKNTKPGLTIWWSAVSKNNHKWSSLAIFCTDNKSEG